MAATANSRTASVDLPTDVLDAIDELVGTDRRAELVRAAFGEHRDRQQRLRVFDALVDQPASAPTPAWKTSRSPAEWVSNLR